MKSPRFAAVLVLLSQFTLHHAQAEDVADGSKAVTWADSHPELLEIFGRPFTPEGIAHRKKNFLPWPPLGKFPTKMLAVQPTVVKGEGDLLVANTHGWVVRSTNGGRSWEGGGKPPLVRQAPDGFTHMKTSLDGIGLTTNGSILVHSAVQYNDGRKYEGFSDPSYHCDVYVLRSTDGGKTWNTPVRLNAAPTENAGANRTRFFNLPNGHIALAMPVWHQTASGEAMSKEQMFEAMYFFSSADDGMTWQRSKHPICRYGLEPDLLVLPSGRILAAVRYQRHKLPSDPADLVSPHLMRSDQPPYTKSKTVGLGLAARLTAVLWSDDGGKTWTEPRLVTGFDEQTGSLVRLSDGTVILVFGHKTDGLGQRFMLSYDEGETWTRRVFQLHNAGQYASSVVLDDETIATIIHSPYDGGTHMLTTLMWRAPSKEEASAAGFWTPRVAEPLGVPVAKAAAGQ